jgi:hypothetical protein
VTITTSTTPPSSPPFPLHNTHAHTHINNQNPLKLPIFNYDLLLLFLLDPIPKLHKSEENHTQQNTHTHTQKLEFLEFKSFYNNTIDNVHNV